MGKWLKSDCLGVVYHPIKLSKLTGSLKFSQSHFFNTGNEDFEFTIPDKSRGEFIVFIWFGARILMSVCFCDFLIKKT